MNQLFSKLPNVVLSALFAAFAGSAVAADYTWTGGAENNVLTDGGNWSPKLPTTSHWTDVGIIDGLAAGTVLSMGEDYTAPKLKLTNTSSVQLDLAGHKLSFANNNNYAWSLSDCELTVTDSVGGGTNVFANASAASRLDVNSKLIYDGVSYAKIPVPTFPEDKSAELVFKNGTTAVFGQADNNVPGNYSRIVVDNAALSWVNNFSRNATGVTKGWTIVAQNNGTVTGSGYCYQGSSDVSDPIRFVATSGGKISMPSAVNRFYWHGGFEAYCTNATIQLNGGNATSTYSSFGKFVCVDGEMTGLLSVRANNEVRFSGTCTALPALSFAADAQDNDILFTNVTCASFPIGDLATLGRGTNNTVRILGSELSSSSTSTPLNLFTSCGSSPSENSVIEFSGRKASLVSRGQSNNRSINIGQNTTAVAAADRPHLRFRIPEGGFEDTPIRAEVKNSISWEFNPVIEVVPDGVRYGDEPTYHPLIGFGEGGAGGGWTGARPPTTASNLDNLNEISADYLPHGAELVVESGTRKSVGVLLPERIVLSAEYASELGTVSAKLSLNREPDAEIHMVYGWANGGSDVSAWENDAVVDSLEVGPVSGFGTDYLHVRFYTVNGDGTVSWSPAFAASDDPKLSEPTADVGGTYVKVSGVLEDAGIISAVADITLAVAKADEEYGEPVTVKTGVRAGEAFDRAVPGLAPATAYKFRLTATNEHGISTTVEGAFTTASQPEYGEDPVADWNGLPSVDSAATISLPYDAPWGGDAAALVDVHAVWGFAEDALGHDVIVAAGTLGAGVGFLKDAKPGETYFVQLYAQSGEKTSERTAVRSVQIPSESAVVDSRSESTRSSYAVSGSVTPGVGLTRVWLRYSFNSDALDQSVLVCEKQIGDEPSFVCELEPTQSGDTLHWQVVVSNDYASATWGDFAWGDKTESATQILTDTEKVDWTWQTAGAGDWQEAGNWSAKDKTGFPNTAGARALFTAETDGATATLQDDVTLAELSVADGTTTVKGEGHAMTVSKMTLSGEGAVLALDDVTVAKSLSRPTFSTGGAVAEVWLKNGATAAFTEGSFAAGSRWRASGEGTVLTFSGNTIRWSKDLTSDWSWLAEDGAQIVGSGFMHLGSKDDTRDVKFVALNGGSITCGGGYNRTSWEFSGVVVAATNGGTVAFGAANAGPNDGAPGYTCHSRFLVHNGNVTGNINLATNNVMEVSGDATGSSTLGALNFASYGTGNRVSVNGGTLQVGNLTVHGTDNEIKISNASVTGGNILLAGSTNCTFVLENAAYTNGQTVSDQKYARGGKFVLRGASKLVTTHTSCSLGAKTEPDYDQATLVFEPTGDGFAEAPVVLAGANDGIFEYLPLRVDVSKYRRLSRYLMPLIRGVWRGDSKATAEAIESHLPAGALPKGAHLQWNGATLCVQLPSMGGLMLIVR